MTTQTLPDLRDATVEWLSAILDSAYVDVIGKAHWWDRATSALLTAATATTYGEACSTAARKLQVGVLRADSSATLTRLDATIGPRLTEWCEIVTTEAPYLVALTRIHRQNRKSQETTA
ncbi:hypothetical protein [Phytoactinopolyspora limicola]|uniref:hypothetical protein n=1 Tax=Phytoactinopolyspora limicola TaxID=2715536 RepID=UPI00140A4F94|nr:hypothetical protein [Phytoactinopolyspora limicola]